MEQIRKPFQGVWNIVRFNWHFYILSVALSGSILFLYSRVSEELRFFLSIVLVLIIGATLISLIVSFYIYDLSNLYKLNWLNGTEGQVNVVNINAGFDETSVLLKARFINSKLTVLDFYEPEKHTEISIKRARKAYPPFPGTKLISTSQLTLQDYSADKIFLFFSAHEIRDKTERAIFFKELHRILKPGGQIFVTEHLRDMINFMAYNFGFYHFLPRHAWYEVFKTSSLKVQSEQKITPFITNFTIEKNGGAT